MAACPIECHTSADCEGEPWPSNLACPEDERGWSCEEEVCAPACGLQCSVPSDCASNEWTLDCLGYFRCIDSLCEMVCDYDSCGDGACTAAQGEDEETCPRDCQEGCALPIDCRYETWNAGCLGRWICDFLSGGVCEERCDSLYCNNDACDLLVGETEVTCPADCLGGPCSDVIECLGATWDESCGGHWRCNPPPVASQTATGACESICDPTGCPAGGDGTCDVLGGETPTSCPADCSDYTCTQSDDCDTLTPPSGCNGWICSGRLCAPQCD